METIIEYIIDILFSLGVPFVIITTSSLIISIMSGFLRFNHSRFFVTWLSIFVLLFLANKFSLFGEFSIYHPLDSIDFLQNQLTLILAYYLIILLLIKKSYWKLAGKVITTLFGLTSILFLIYPILSPLYAIFSITLTVCVVLMEGVASFNLWCFHQIKNLKSNELNNRQTD